MLDTIWGRSIGIAFSSPLSTSAATSVSHDRRSETSLHQPFHESNTVHLSLCGMLHSPARSFSVVTNL